MNHLRFLVVASALALATLPFGPDRAGASHVTFTVNSAQNVGDVAQGNGICEIVGAPGVCTLRAAIEEANAHFGADTINFALGAGVPTIAPGGALPAITQPVTINGNTGGATRIELDGFMAGAGSDGLQINAGGGGSTIRAMVINRFGGDGIQISVSGSDTVVGNYIGTNSAGEVLPAFRNLGNGVYIAGSPDNIIGGTTAADRNVISGNALNGVRIDGATSTGNMIRGNNLGPPAVSGAAGNLENGVYIENAGNNTIGGVNTFPGVACEGACNIIAGNMHNGIFINGSSAGANMIKGNHIGVSITGEADQGNSIDGIHVGSAPSTVIGGTTPGERNVISGNDANGIEIAGALVLSNVIQGNYIGVGTHGADDIGNGVHGVYINNSTSNQVGGFNSLAGTGCGGQCNLISGNDGRGIFINGENADSNVVWGNIIGLKHDGSAAIGNTLDGIRVDGGADSNVVGFDDANERNVISGNGSDGVQISDAGTTNNYVRGNYIGTNADATADRGNTFDGILIVGSPDNKIGLIGGQNVISGNGLHGVEIVGVAATGNRVQGNRIGTNGDGTSPLGNAVDGVHNESALNDIGGPTAGEGNLISGNGDNGIYIAGSDNEVYGNYIGTNAAGTASLANQTGIRVVDGIENLIGGTNASQRNVVSGNDAWGILLLGPSLETSIRGNYIGVGASGASVLSGGIQGGILVQDSTNNFIGGTVGTTPGGACTGACNVVAGNGSYGVEIIGSGSTLNDVVGNYIGLAVNGTAALGNFSFGVSIVSASNNIVGGSSAAARNIISANGWGGVEIQSSAATANRIQGNYIGTDVTGAQDRGNDGYGVLVVGGDSNIIGGSGAGEGNVIAGTNLSSGKGYGVFLNSDSNIVQGNLIGTRADGVTPLGNDGIGVCVCQIRSGNMIGNALVPSAANTIAFNGADGVVVELGAGNRISGNSIHSNGGLGIDLLVCPLFCAFGVTANDLDDPDAGSNNLQNFPLLTSYGGNVVGASLNSTPSSGFTLEFFHSPSCDGSGHGEGRTYIGSLVVGTDANGDGAVQAAVGSAAPIGSFVTATARDGAGNTSEFSACIPAFNDADDDNDGYTDAAESGAPLCANAVNDDPFDDVILPDTSVNDGCPAVGPAETGNDCIGAADDDADGVVNDGCAEFGVYSEGQFKIGTSSQDPCGLDGWPSDLVTGGISTNKTDIVDLGSYVAPIRRLNKDPGDAGFSSRWDVVPGATFGQFINLADLAAFVSGPSGFPPMLGAARAFNATCPFPP